MHIVVCVKAISDHLPDLGSFQKDDASGSVHMGDWDSAAVETALNLRESSGEGRVTVLTAGPVSWEPVLRRSLGMGADAAFRVEHKPDPVNLQKTARALHEALFVLKPDLVLCGAMGEDCMYAAIGPMLATAGNLPFLTMAMGIEINGEGFSVLCEGEGGKRLRYALPLGCLITVQTGIYSPRYPKLSLMLKADKAEIPLLDFAEKDVAFPVSAEKFTVPPPSRKVSFLEGNIEEKAGTFIHILIQRGWLQACIAKEGA
ncbi:electron transfer flavoprotein subunit beta/FixA family protein [Desulfobotulus mexicanus]|uniref:Electron transfer flavoprotein alpha/beta-subunit N-terminal domain-containing protein n=1 Tax=Desulfobotulus mexicanus TaxID=2586642 RepID=A0A5Q4VG21_9BACT|nr:hypothetical protein [Desulfobotulus mexicanus]TYT75898.1 hypothetical protein FIM25_03100 [Desulfobotulus mexicanus]